MEFPLGLDDLCTRIGVTPADLRDLFKVSDAAISQWREGGLPPGRAIELERKMPGVVRAAEIKTVLRKPKAKPPKAKRRAA